MKMNIKDKFTKVVEWSEEDGCYIGSAPGLIGQCCHGDNQFEVFTELCIIVDEWLALTDVQEKSAA